MPAGVLVTRPEPGGTETAARVASLGWTPVLAPSLVLTPRRFALPRCQAVLVTSRAGARALPSPIPGLPLLAVGAGSAEVARAAGWAPVWAAEGNAESLAALAALRLDPAGPPLLLAVGQGYALDLADALRGSGFRVIRRLAYAATPAGSLPAAALAALTLGGLSKILFHSPRSAACAINLFRTAGHATSLARLEAIVISPRVAAIAAEALAPLTWRGIVIAESPGENALLALLGRADRQGRPTVSGEP